LPKADEIKPLLETALEAHLFSAYQCYAQRGELTEALWGGVTSYWPGGTSVGPATKFDIGSVTKALVTTTALARAVDASRLSLEEPLEKWVTEFRGRRLGRIPLANLLSHSAGLCAWKPIGRDAKGEVVRWFCDHESEILTYALGAQAIYSDLSFLLLGLVVSREWGSVEAAFQREVFQPLGLKETGYGPIVPATKCAATEYSLTEDRLIQGEVFDDNTRYLGGRCAHAGLFSTSRDTAIWAREWLRAVLGESDWIRSSTAVRFTRPSGHAPESSWALGWDTKSKAYSSAGAFFSRLSFGHLGYPGCSVWIDPLAKGFAVFFSNRVHPSRLDERIRSFRPALHDAIAGGWGVDSAERKH
jgi:serine-type D-Ala-D-Ala carboxypeptidase